MSVTSTTLDTYFTRNDCNTDYVGRTDSNPIESLTNTSFVVDNGSYDVRFTRTSAAPSALDMSTARLLIPKLS